MSEKITTNTTDPEETRSEYALNVKQVKLFKFTQNSQQINIYVEPITDRTGRIIVATPYKLFQRYFDGVSGGIYRFLASNDASTISCVFDASEEDETYILKQLSPIWDFFQESIAGHVESSTL